VQSLEPYLEVKKSLVGNISADRGTVGAKIRRHAELQPNHPAVVASGFASLSYRELQEQIDQVRAALRLAGYGRSARVAIAMRNDPQTALAVVCMACCAVSIPLNPRQTLGEIDSCLVALQPDAVLVAKGVDSEARRAAEGRGITILEATQSKDGTLNFGITAPPANPDAGSVESDEPNADAPAFILQTSGTSAEPKLIPTSHRNMLAAAARVQAWFDLTPLDRCLSVSPVFYAHGLHVTVFAPLLSGGTVAFPTNASRFDYSEWFSDLRPTWYSAGPTHHRFVLDQIRVKADEKPRHSLRFVLSGGAPLPRDVWEGLQHALLVPVVEHYGSSEGMQICSNLLPPGPAKLGRSCDMRNSARFIGKIVSCLVNISTGSNGGRPPSVRSV
jgi:oxalate---CoA ligase